MTMKDYTNHCTVEQTRKAYELGAPLQFLGYIYYDSFKNKCIETKKGYYAIPTTQQMIGWLEKEKNFGFSRNVGKYIIRYSVYRFGDSEEGLDTDIITTTCSTELVAIDAALNYLEKV